MPSFSPTIITFLDAAGNVSDRDDVQGRSVYDVVTGLLASVDPLLYQSIGCLHLHDDVAEVRPIVAHGVEYFPRGFRPAAAGDFAATFTHVLTCVQSHDALTDIQARGYDTAGTAARVIIVASTLDEHIEPAVRAVIAALQVRNPSIAATNMILLVLREPEGVGDLPNDPDDDAVTYVNPLARQIIPRQYHWRRLLVAAHGNLPPVSYAFIYSEHRGAGAGTFLNAREVTYAMAEATFGLCVAGITNSGEFQEFVQRRLQARDPNDHTGTLATSAVRFPRPEAEEFSANQLSAQLLDRVLRRINHQRVRQADGDPQRQAAYQRAAAWRYNTFEDAPRPGVADRSFWPPLLALQDRQSAARLYDQLVESSVDLFQPFARVALPVVAGRTVINAETLRSQEALAWGKLATWRGRAAKAWQAAGVALRQGLGHTVDQLWLGPQGHVDLAYAYVRELENQLHAIRQENAALRAQHQRFFDEDRDRYRRLGEDERWGQPAPEPDADPPATSQPLFAPQISQPLPGTPALPYFSAQAAPPVAPVAPANQRLPAADQQIVANLAARAKWMRQHQPSPGQLVAATAMAAPPLTLLTLSLFRGGFSNPHLALLVFLAVTATIGLAAALYRDWTRRRIYNAEQDALNFLKLCFIYRCECYEDQLRVALLGPLLRVAEHMVERLEHVELWLQRLIANHQRHAAAVETELFTGPSFYQDVLIGNGLPLGKPRYGDKRLAYVDGELVKERVGHPAEPWHRDDEDLAAQLVEYLLHQQREQEPDPLAESILGLPEEALAARVVTFAYQVNAPYFRERLIAIEEALRADREVFRESFTKTQPMYHALAVPVQQPFVAGRAADRLGLHPQDIPPDTRQLDTWSEQWLLAARFVHSGTMPLQPPTTPLAERAAPPLAEDLSFVARTPPGYEVEPPGDVQGGAR